MGFRIITVVEAANGGLLHLSESIN